MTQENNVDIEVVEEEISNEQIIQDALAPLKDAEAEPAKQEVNDNVEQITQEVDKHPVTSKRDDYVTFDTEEQQQKFNDVWKQARASDEKNAQLQSQLEALRNHNNQMDNALSHAIGEIEKIKGSQYQQESTKAIDGLRSQIKEAQEIGDDDTAQRLNEQLFDLKLEQKEREKQEEQLKQQAQQQLQAQQQQNLWTPEDERYVQNLQSELDGSGNFVRPFLQIGHPEYRAANEKAMQIARQKATEKPGQNLDIKEIMTELDRYMGVGKEAPTQAAVMSGANLTAPGKTEKIKVTRQEKEVWDKLGLSEKDMSRQFNNIRRASRLSVKDL